MNAWNNFKKHITDVIFPKYCLVCDFKIDTNEEFDYLCGECFRKIRQIKIKPFKNKYLTRVLYYGSYADKNLQKIIKSLKYNFVKTLSIPLGYLEAYALEENGIEALIKTQTIITFIHLNILKERCRGFNQSELLANYLSSHFSIPVIPILKRKYFTPAQATVIEKYKKKNIKGVFCLRQDLLFNTEYKKINIILVDDVFTTGSTITEAAKILYKAGFKNIWGITVAG
ncbi:MAG: hypothetical protein AAB593_00810 [Patescibacteria group bacterium]